MQLGQTCTRSEVPWHNVSPTARVSVKADGAALLIESFAIHRLLGMFCASCFSNLQELQARVAAGQTRQRCPEN